MGRVIVGLTPYAGDAGETGAVALAHELAQPLSAISNYLRASIRLLEKDAPEARALVLEALRQAELCNARAIDLLPALREATREDGADTRRASGS